MDILIIIYLEGFANPKPKQEKKLFEIPSSKRIWNKVFKKFGFENSEFIILPKELKSEKEENKFNKIISQRFSQKADNHSKFITIITGDHDEKNPKTLEQREKFAEFIKTSHEDKNCYIVLKRDKNFKIESVMSLLIDQKINKKILKDKLKNECPDLIELFSIINISGEKNIIQNMLKNIKKNNQNNLIFKKINDLINEIIKKK